MNSAFPDHFSLLAQHYVDFRPRYPLELFSWLASLCQDHQLAWDCGTGNGQAATDLAAHFERVVASDASAAQIAQALPHPRVDYRVAPAEHSGLPSHCADLVIVAQAMHWFDQSAFGAEVERVLKPGGVFAAWCYSGQHLADASVDGLVQAFYLERIAPYWPEQRRHVANGYCELVLPLPAIAAPEFTLSADWNLAQLLGYFRSWSATAAFIRQHGYDPVAELEPELSARWGDPGQSRRIEWPLTLRVARLPDTDKPNMTEP
jgi:SAM-dependent methyltransferase